MTTEQSKDETIASLKLANKELENQVEEQTQNMQLRLKRQMALFSITQAVQKMKEPNDLTRVIGILYEELKWLGMNFELVSVHYLADPSTGLFQTFQQLQSGESKIYEARLRPRVFERWKKKKPTYRQDVQAETGVAHFLGWSRQEAGFEVASTFVYPFPQGVIGFLSKTPDAFGEQERRFVRYVAEVLSVGVARMEDLVALVARTEEQEALLKINIAVQNMKEKEDMGVVLQTCFDAIRDLGIGAVGLTMKRIADRDKGIVDTVRVEQDGVARFRHEYKEKNRAEKWRGWSVEQEWDLQNNHIEWASLLGQRLGSTVYFVIDIPFAAGIFRVMSTQKHGFTHRQKQILRLFAEVLGLGVARLNDIDAVLAAEQSKRQIAEHIEDAIYSVNAQTLEFAYLSPAFERLAGYTEEDIFEMGGRLEFFARVIGADVEETRQRMVMQSEKRGAPISGRSEIWLQCKDGTQKCFEDHWTGIWDENNVLMSTDGVLRDVTHRKQLESQLIQAQKMESVGALTGGIAHDFNNLMTVILGNCRYLLRDLPNNSPHREDAEEIQRAGDRAVALVQQLMAFSRKQVLDLKMLDLIDVIQNMLAMVRRLIGEDIEVTAMFTANAGSVMADAVQLERVVLNLALNARDAMPNGGKLTFTVENVELDKDYTASHLEVEPGPYVLLSICDTGIGMDAETCAQIFEPFFTTKTSGRGTGLGLATVYGVIRQCNGHIVVNSEVGQGATFKIYLPRGEVTTPVAPVLEDELAKGGTETVLLVEDDEGVRSVIQRGLRGLGYSVLVAENGRDALRILENRVQVPDLVITDVVMPDMGGFDLIDHLSETGLEMPVIFITGYMNHLVEHQDRVVRDAPFLQKPFDVYQLAQKIRGVLDESQGDAHGTT